MLLDTDAPPGIGTRGKTVSRVEGKLGQGSGSPAGISSTVRSVGGSSEVGSPLFRGEGNLQGGQDVGRLVREVGRRSAGSRA